MMNKRMFELAKQAYMWSVNEAKGDRNGCIVGSDYFLAMEKKKFAELIVRECVDCCRGAGLADDVAVRNNLGFNDGIAEAVVHIQKHFGVE